MQNNVKVRDPLIVVIMAGGLGKRMQSDLPKVLHRLAGLPILLRVIRAAMGLLSSGEDLSKIMIIVGKYYPIIKETVDKYLSKEEQRFIEYVFQNEPKGTGHAVQQILPALGGYPLNTKVMVLSGDVPLISTKTLLGLLGTYDFNTNTKAVLISTNLDDPTGNGRILRDEQHEFVNIVEEKDANPKQKQIKEVNAGIYLFHAGSLLQNLPKINNQNAQNEYYLPDVLPLIRDDSESNKKSRIVSYIMDKEDQYELLNINDPAGLLQAENVIHRRGLIDYNY
jgi:UDP-N-acetylglucosamine diphosphorylase/glucosamine-1-phosphate N-acetyltransferase